VDVYKTISPMYTTQMDPVPVYSVSIHTLSVLTIYRTSNTHYMSTTETCTQI